MNWNNLKLNHCPKCAKELDFISDSTMMMCTISCGFMVSSKRMAEINSSQNNRKINRQPKEYDNFSALQNLGSLPREEEE